MNENISSSPKKPGVAVPDTESSLRDICVAGITPFTTIDFPGRLAGVFYLQGCPWRCRYCYNAEFWSLKASGTLISLEKILHFLNARKGHLDGIVFSGGEPTIHGNLPLWMRSIKELGFEIGLHTGGMLPPNLERVLPLCDWVGFDIKAPFAQYEKVTRVAGSGESARRSAELLLVKGISCEFRTTVHPELLSEDELLFMARELASMGCRSYCLQMFRPDHCSDKELRENPPRGLGISAALRRDLKGLFADFRIRE